MEQITITRIEYEELQRAKRQLDRLKIQHDNLVNKYIADDLHT